MKNACVSLPDCGLFHLNIADSMGSVLVHAWSAKAKCGFRGDESQTMICAVGFRSADNLHSYFESLRGKKTRHEPPKYHPLGSLLSDRSASLWKKGNLAQR